MSDNLLRDSVPTMRIGVCPEKTAFLATEENIKYILDNNDKFQNNWLRGLIACANYIKKDIVVKKMIEIGSFQGESTSLFAMYLTPEELYAIDPHANGYDSNDSLSFSNFDDVIHNFKVRTAPFPCVKYIRNFSVDAAKQFEDDSFDFVYIDGDHTYEGVLKDVKAYLPKIRVGGYIGGHDLGRKEITDVMIECFDDVDVHFEDSSWLIKITPEHKRSFAENDLPGERKRKSKFVPVTKEDFELYFLQQHGRGGQVETITEFFKYFENDDIKTVVELNSFDGHTTAILAKYLNPTTLYAVDDMEIVPKEINQVVNIENLENEFVKNVDGFDCVKLLKYDPETVLSDDVFEDNSIDLIYIRDTYNKENLRDLMALCIPKLKNNGYLAGEGWGGGHTVQACLDTVGEPDIFFGNSSWITKIQK